MMDAMRAPTALMALLILLPSAAPGLAFTAADTRTPLSAAVRPGGWVALRGRIGPGSPAVVRAALDRAGPGRPAVLVDSPGGSIAAAFAIGRLIRDRGLAVAVARVVGASPTDAGAQCASACVFLLAAGVGRSVGPGAEVGVHRLVDWSTYSRTWDVYRILRRHGVVVGRELLSRRVLSSRDVFTDAPPRAYAEAKAYLAGLGVSPNLVALMERTPAARVHWMTPRELRSTRLVTAATPPSS